MKRAAIALMFGLAVSICVVMEVPVVGWLLSLPALLLDWPLTSLYLKLFGPVLYPNQVWLGRDALEWWTGFGFNLLFYGSIAFWCQKRIAITYNTARPSRTTLWLLRIGLSAFGVAVTAILSIEWYGSHYGFKYDLDPHVPAYVIYSFPFYLLGVAGALLSLAAGVVIVGRRIGTTPP